MRGRPLDIAAFGRAADFVLVAAAIIATAVRLDAHKAEPSLNTTPSAPTADPLAAELSRCQSIGMAAQNDSACASAWAENRRRFFTYRPADSIARTMPPSQAVPKSEDR
jgi:conjugative transfer region protein TrbK